MTRTTRRNRTSQSNIFSKFSAPNALILAVGLRSNPATVRPAIQLRKMRILQSTRPNRDAFVAHQLRAVAQTLGRRNGPLRNGCFGILLLVALFAAPAHADSSSPKLAAYYDRHMAIVEGKVYAWEGRSEPVKIPTEAIQVGVGRDTYYVLNTAGKLIRFREKSSPRTVLMVGIKKFSAGRSGVMAITNDGALWWVSGKSKSRIADHVASAAVGDGANYYITSSGGLFVKGSAHRGQYGDGRLKRTDRFVQTASGAAHITAHTGHAIMLMTNGDVVGTGGNIYGPVGKHGLGDKAVRWSKIMSGAQAIATGSSHSLAIRKDGTLMAWGSGYDTEPVRVLTEVVAVAAGSRTTIAIKRDDTLWQWNRAETPRQVRLPD